MPTDKAGESMRFYKVMHAIFAGFFRVFFRVKVEGRENEPVGQAYIACANHISFADVIIMGAVLKTPICFFAKKELFSIPLLSQLIRALGAFPVDRKSAAGAAQSIHHTEKLIAQGRTIGIFPQGTRCKGVDPRNTKFKNGAAMMAYRSGAQILPICIQTKGYKMRLFGRVNVRIGKPISAEEMGFGSSEEKNYSAATEVIFNRITEMIE